MPKARATTKPATLQSQVDKMRVKMKHLAVWPLLVDAYPDGESLLCIQELPRGSILAVSEEALYYAVRPLLMANYLEKKLHSEVVNVRPATFNSTETVIELRGRGVSSWRIANASPELQFAIAFAKFTQPMRPFVREHVATLARRRLQLVHFDAYGVEDDSAWQKEIAQFFARVICARQPELRFDAKAAEYLPALMEAEVRQYRRTHRVSKEPPEDPIEFETHCASVMSAAGWRARATVASGDQGVDVVAEKGKYRLVLQCKRYSKPVGNKAVQEVIAGMQFEDATHGVVVTNATYTKSAQQLASKSSIVLLHVGELKAFATQFPRYK
jgi:restriction system protein